MFTLLFSDPAILRELYCALDGITLPPDAPVSINTLEDVLFMDFINDILTATQILPAEKYMPKTLTWGPVSGQNRHTRMPLLPLTPLKYIIGHIFPFHYGIDVRMYKFIKMPNDG
jgi:hypothetical protein